MTAPPPRTGAQEAPQRRHMTVMFCDLVESTPLAALLDPEDFGELLSDYRQACERAIERFGGYVAVYAGDGMTVYFGYPRAHEDDAQRAIHSALAILDEIAALNARLRDLHDISIQVRIGIHSGVVIAQEIGGGAGTRSQLDISGEMPHIAARLESIAPPGCAVISETTRQLVDGYFDTEPLGEKTLKGVSRPVLAHSVLGPTGAVGRLEVAASRRLTPVIGREEELARLASAREAVAGGRGVIAHVKGEAGIGKSRLVHELAELHGNAGSVQVWQCSAHHLSTSLHPVITLLERLLGLDRSAAADDQLHVLEQAVVAAGLDAAEAVPLLADLLSVPIAGGAPQTLAPRDARTALLRVLEGLLVTDARRHPLLLVVEDLHWADPTTVELLGRIVRSLRRLPVLCVVTFRDDFEPPWTGDRVLEIELGRLSSAQVRAMAAAANGEAVDPALLDWVESTADGVPLFIEEMLKVGSAPSAAAVPPTLEGLLTERLDRLPELGEVIDRAAILGREFDRALLAAVDPGAAVELEPALTQLARQDVLRPVEGAPSRCEFTHGLLHEAAYARIVRRRRRDLHGQVAQTLAHSFPDVVEREPELIAHHWSAAGEPAAAVGFWHEAGTHALERAAYLEAAEHFRRGLEALDDAGLAPADELQRVDFLTHIGASLQAGRGYAAAGVEDAYAKARAACQRVAGDGRLAAVIRGQWMFHLLRGQYGTALELADEMLALGERPERPAPLAEGHLYRGLVHMYLGEFDSAREHLDDAVDRYEPPVRSDHIYEAQGDTGVGALAYLAVVLWNLGHAGESRRCSDLSLERAETVGGPVTRAQAWGMRSLLHLSRAEPVELGQWVEKTRVHSVDNDLGYWRAVSSLLGGWLQGRAGHLERGMAHLDESLRAYRASGSRLGLPHFHILSADLRRAAGDQPSALVLLRVGEEYIEETGERFSESELFRFKGRLLMDGDAPDPDAATAAFERAISAAHEQNAKLLELQAVTRLVEHQQKIGEPTTGLDRIAELCDWFGPRALLPDVGRARALLEPETMAR